MGYTLENNINLGNMWLKKKKIPSMDSVPTIPVQSYRLTKRDAEMSLTLRYETLARWASEQWQARYPDKPFLILWASENCGNNLARQLLKEVRQLKGKARYTGHQPL